MGNWSAGAVVSPERHIIILRCCPDDAVITSGDIKGSAAASESGRRCSPVDPWKRIPESSVLHSGRDKEMITVCIKSRHRRDWISSTTAHADRAHMLPCGGIAVYITVR